MPLPLPARDSRTEHSWLQARSSPVARRHNRTRPYAEEDSQMTTPFNPDADYPDPRDDQQRQADGLASRAQSGALTDFGLNPHATINEMIEGIRAARLRIAGLQLEDPPIQFDVWPDPPPGDPGQPNMGVVIL